MTNKSPLTNARGNNLKNITVSFPLGLFTCITGVSGSGKSTLINDTLYRHVARTLNNASALPAACDQVLGLKLIDKVVDINQRRYWPYTTLKPSDLYRFIHPQSVNYLQQPVSLALVAILPVDLALM
jgi:Excinuclease ABC subunit A